MDQRVRAGAADGKTAPADAERRPPTTCRRVVLAAEFCLLFIAAPLVMAFLVEARLIWWALGAVTVAGLGLLAATRSFRWRELVRRPFVPNAHLALAYAGAVPVVAVALTLWLAPRYFFVFPAARPTFWLIVMAFYPLLSVIPQELIYRVLFFRRYGVLFGRRAVAVAVNAVVFSLAHLFYWNWPALILPLIGGALFGAAYSANRSFAFVCLLHAIAGWTFFTVGLGGRFFFHGATELGLL